MKKEVARERRDHEAIITIGSNIAKYRALKGLSQRKLSTICEIEQSSLNKYENGKIEASVSTLSLIAKGLNIKLYQLFEEGQ